MPNLRVNFVRLLPLAIAAASACFSQTAISTSKREPFARMLGSATPAALTPLSPDDTAWIERTLASLSLDEKVGQLIMPWVGGEYAPVGSPEFEQARKWVQDDRVGGIVVSIGLPLSYAAKLNELQALAKVPLLVASDMENGPGFRMSNIYALPSMLPQGGGTAFPPVMALGATRSDSLAFKLGQVTGREARAVGVQLAFGPVLDVNSNPLNPVINVRSFGEDPVLVGRLASAFIRGAQSTGLMTTAKHFPGHGDTETNSHETLPVIRADKAYLDSVSLPPFRAAVATGVEAIMTAHIAVVGVEGRDAGPATLSHKFMTDILRREMGFTGLLFTDAMTMGGVSKRYGATEPLPMAIAAGADVLLMPKDVPTAIRTVIGAVRDGRVPESRIDQSVRRILAAKARGGLRRGRFVDLYAVDRIVGIPAHTAVAREIATRSITLARDSAGLVPIGTAVRRILSLTYAEPFDLIASRAFNEAMRAGRAVIDSVRTDARSTPAEYAALRAKADSADLLIVSIYASASDFAPVRGAPNQFPEFVRELSRTKPVVLVAFGSPYVLSVFPFAPTYLVPWGTAPVSQKAAADALLGVKPITGLLPVSVPPGLHYGEGILRPVTKSPSFNK